MKDSGNSLEHKARGVRTACEGVGYLLEVKIIFFNSSRNIKNTYRMIRNTNTLSYKLIVLFSASGACEEVGDLLEVLLKEAGEAVDGRPLELGVCCRRS